MNLRDLQAPPWRCTVGERRFVLRPLSLQTFAEAEMYGLTLSRLSDGKDTQAWIELFALLTGADPTDTTHLTEEVLPVLLTDPIGFEHFRVRVAESFSGKLESPEAESPAAKPKQGPRRVQKYKSPEAQVAEKQEMMDYGFVLDISRTAHIPVHDIMQMTFYGFTCISKSLERTPPTPGLAGLLGGLG